MIEMIFTVEENAYGRYGIKVCDKNGNLYRYYASLSYSKDELTELCKKCKEGNISHLHIDDIICDFLCQLSEV